MKPKTNKYGPWFRAYAEAIDDPKIQKLGDKLGFFWFNCLCLACQNGGLLPTVQDISWKLRRPEKEVSASLASLHERGLLDREGDTFAPHNWTMRQFDSDVSTARVRRFREQKKLSETVSETPMKRCETVSETPPDTDTDTDTDKKHSKVTEFVSFEADLASTWEWFCETYPGDVNEDWDAQIFNSVVQGFEDIRNIRKNLPIWMESSKWKGGYIDKAENFLRKRMFNSLPKARDSPNGNRPKSYLDSVTSEMQRRIDAGMEPM